MASPFSLTPPPAKSRRASAPETPKASRRSAGRQPELGHLVWQLALLEQAVEVLLGLLGCFVAVELRDQDPREAPFGLVWVLGGIERGVREQRVVGRHRLVRDRHDLPEDLLWRLVDADVVV